ncbi:unnamed protein product [Gordionus sp. m RMFG-2023]
MSSKFLTLVQRLTKRYIHSSQSLLSGEYEYQDPKSPNDIVNVTFIDKEGKSYQVKGKIEGACEASLACSTCHVYVKQNFYDKLPPPKDEEEDMLDLAAFLKSNSRLSCQIILDKSLDGLVVTLPAATRNFYVDGHTPQPH